MNRLHGLAGMLAAMFAAMLAASASVAAFASAGLEFLGADIVEPEDAASETAVPEAAEPETAASETAESGAAAGEGEIVIRWRDRRPVGRGTLESLGPDGLRWTAPDGIGQEARWTSIRAVEGLDDAHRHLVADGTALWRASSRLARGETALAAPIFERLAERWRGEDSQRRREALAGLVRCRIRAGDPVGAALTALERLELDADPSASDGLPRLADGWPIEAPLWAVDPEGEDAARLRVGVRRFAESPVAAEAAWIESTLIGTAPPESAPEAAPEPALVPALETSPPSLASRCARLRRIDETPPEALAASREAWLESAAAPAEERWIHARIAAALAGGPDRALRRRALLEWLCIPARFPDSVEAPLALEAAAEVAADLGDDDLAWRLSRAAERAAEDLRTRPVPRTMP